MLNDLINKAAGENSSSTGNKASSNKEFEELFVKAMAQVYNSNRLYGDRLGTNQLKEMLDKIIR